MQRAIVFIVDLPGCYSLIRSTDVFSRADLTTVIFTICDSFKTHLVRRIGASVDLLLDQKGDKVDEVGANAILTDSKSQVD